MKYEVIIQPSFQEDLSQVLIEKQRDSAMAAQRFLDDVEASFARLEQYPRSHPVVPEPPYDLMGIHWYRVSNYHIFYRIDDNKVKLFRMLHIRASLYHLLLLNES